VAAGGLMLLVVYSVFVVPVRADRDFDRIRLGDPRSAVLATFGEPKDQVEPDALSRYRDCELKDGVPAETVDLWIKGFDSVFLVGHSDGRVVAKCSAAW